MRGDFELIIKEFSNDDITIYPISDLHVGSAEFIEEAWYRFKKQLLSEPNSYITINGDMMNNATRSSVSNVFEEKMRPSEQKRWLANQLMDIRDKILCVVSGNHERRSEKEADDNPLYDVCCKLDIEDLFRSNAAFLKLQFGNKESNGLTNPTYTGCVIHGTGGGILTGSAVNRNERFGMMIDGIDFLTVGHVHKGAITKPKKLFIDKFNNKVSYKQFVVVGSSAWTDYGGYALQKMLLPASNDVQKMVLSGNRKKIEVRW